MKAIKKAVCAAALCAAAALVFTGCSSISSKKAESKAESKEDSIIPITEEEEPASVVAAPEEGDDVDQGREGRPTDSWNEDAPPIDESEADSEAESEAESFALAEDADDEAATRAE